MADTTTKLKTFITHLTEWCVPSASFRSLTSSEDEVAFTLSKQVAAFTKLYRNPQADTDALTQSAQEVEGSLRTLVVLKEIEQSQLDALLAELRNLLRAKSILY